ncbi:MAG TPA: HAD family hydrolase [Planctomycetaceae bacterium]|nr:HAD family hydrolase [Planctomycetaceae bacterium]
MTSTLPGTSIEIVRPLNLTEPPSLAVFDFDGTLSLIRGGWTDIMVGMMFERLRELRRSDESDDALQELIRRYVLDLNGSPTIFQMERYAREITDRGGTAEPAIHYHHEYLRRLGERVEERKSSIRAGQTTVADHAVPDAHRFLSDIQQRGWEITLASGTEIEFVREESAILKIDGFFGERVFAPGAKPQAFSKRAVMEDLLHRQGVTGEALVGFGDGVVETRAVTELGGVAVGIACDETHRDGRVDPRKRQELIAAGAAVIIPDYRDGAALLNLLCKQ